MKFIYHVLLITVLVVVPALAAGENTILVLGDSLSAAYGIEKQQGWVSLLQQRLNENRYDFRVANGSISGDTTAGGLARFASLVKRYRPSIVIIELGANDGLRGQSLSVMQANLQQIIHQAQKQQAKVLLIGIHLPPNYGFAYTRLFHATYERLSEHNSIPLIPFLMEGLANNRSHFQPDYLHPTAEAQPILLQNVWQKLVPLLDYGIK